jgi:hypothetical protein
MAPLRRIAGAIVLACIAGGCINTPKTKPPYTGPTDPIADVVAKINSRNGRVDKLRGEGRFSANLIDPQTKKATSADGDITLLYMPQCWARRFSTSAATSSGSGSNCATVPTPSPSGGAATA